jgi:hypothetical protein
MKQTINIFFGLMAIYCFIFFGLTVYRRPFLTDAVNDKVIFSFLILGLFFVVLFVKIGRENKKVE